MPNRFLFAHFLTLALLITAHAVADDSQEASSEAIAKNIKPFLQSYCADCHGQDRAEAKLDLRSLTQERIDWSRREWEAIRRRVQSGEMPPEDAEQHPSPELRNQFVSMIDRARKETAAKTAGDPGVVAARRLSNAEYDYTIRDLTGFDLRPAKEFPVDPANEAGFDNSAESLTMSPALLQKYLAAARHVAEHLLLKPEGIAFAPHPVVTDTDRDKYCVKRIVEFYSRQPTDYADYVYAAWRFRNRARFGLPAATLDSIARETGVSPKYLTRVWSVLEETDVEIGPVAKVQQMWQAISPDAEPAKARGECESIRDYIREARRKLEPKFENLDIEGSNKGSQPFVLWKNRQYASHRMRFDPKVLEIADEAERNHVLDQLNIPAGAGDGEVEASLQSFCANFPDAFYISERGRDYVGKPKDQQEKGRLLSAGFHSMMGYFRDDGPLCELILSDEERQALDLLWQELDFITGAPMRQYTGFVWFERTDSRFMRDPEFDFARAEDKDVTSEPKVKKLKEVYLEKAIRSGGSDTAVLSVDQFFDTIQSQIRWVEEARAAAEPSHLNAILAFAARAFRRPLSATEQEDLRKYYQDLRREQGLTHAEAIEDTLVSIFMSPWFSYRMDLAAKGPQVQPLTDDELANRLSYFLWSSLPDDELITLASRGSLHQPEVIVAQAKRMLTDARVAALATEFGGNWLDFRRFQEHNSVDRERFPNFTDELRSAMFEEPVRFFLDVAQHDRSVLDFLYADHTFVNLELARHYGMTGLDLGKNEWRRIESANANHRGGLLPMSVFMTKNAPGLRTSPVKRGYWVVKRLLGEHIPAPPPNVPELPNDERSLGDLTLREVMARHREHKSCAGCHDRFDSIGLAFEGYGPVGEYREKDLADRPVDNRAVFPNGAEGAGISGLRNYLKEVRQPDFVDNLCRKLLSYALGRSLQLSDEPLIDEMRSKLEANDYRFGILIETIVTSRQFLYKRGQAIPATETNS